MRRPVLLLLLAGFTAVAVGCSGGEAQPGTNARDDLPTASAASTHARPVEPVVAVFLGDSYTEASDSGGGYALRTAEALHWTPVLAGSGGTGYVAVGQLVGGAPYADRVDEVVANDPDVVLVQGSTNDVGCPIAAVGEAARALYAELQRRLPDAKVVVLGPTEPPGVDPVELLELRDAVRNAAEAAGLTFIDPIADGWLRLTEGVYGDPIHPNDVGYAQLADDLAGALRDEGF